MMTLKRFVAQFTDKFDYSNVQKIGTRYFLVNDRLNKAKDKLGRQPFSAGLFLGQEKNGFRPSPALIDIIAKTSTKKAIVNAKSEWLFLCGRDVLEKGIVKCSVKEGMVLVENEQGENLGYGRKKQNMIKNLLDKGAYLRMER